MKVLIHFGVSLLLLSHAIAEMPVVFPDPVKFSQNGGRDFLIESTIPGNFTTPEGVVAAMFLLGDQVQNKSLLAPFLPKTLKSSSHYDGALPLGSYLLGARIKDDTFIISFRDGAMRYLNNTAATQQLVKGAIESTILKNFPSVKNIVYEIDGEIVTAWDA